MRLSNGTTLMEFQSMMILIRWPLVRLKSEGQIMGEIQTKKKTTKHIKTPLFTSGSGYSFNKELISVLFIFVKRDNVPCHLSPNFTTNEKRIIRLIRYIVATIGAIR